MINKDIIRNCNNCLRRITCKSINSTDECQGHILDGEECVEIDGNALKTNTKLMVSDDNEHFIRRYFAEYNDGKIWCFADGQDSWSACAKENFLYVKLWGKVKDRD